MKKLMFVFVSEMKINKKNSSIHDKIYMGILEGGSGLKAVDIMFFVLKNELGKR